jgi:hypothetical protein
VPSVLDTDLRILFWSVLTTTAHLQVALAHPFRALYHAK